MIYSNKPKAITWDKIENVPSIITQLEVNGTAETASKLATAITINDVAFDGSTNITIADDTKLPLTGGTITGDLMATNISATTFTGNLSGNASTADAAAKLSASRTIALTGAITGSATFDGSTNVTIQTESNLSIVPGSGSNLSLPNNVSAGRKISNVNEFVATISDGVDIIDNKTICFNTNTVTLPARSTNLIYDNADGTTSIVQAKIPTDYIDNNTVGFWDFTKWDGTTAVSNSAVGISSVAVANNLTWIGTISKVDGWCGYAAKFDGSTGFFTSANITNFPIGASIREVNCLFTVNKLNVQQYIYTYGSNSTSSFSMYIESDNSIRVVTSGIICNTNYAVDIGKTYLCTYVYDGNNNIYVYVNGTLVYKGVTTPNTPATTMLKVGVAYDGTAFANVILHYLEIRNALRPTSQIGEIANKLLLSCFYDKPKAVAPIVPNNISTTYHEYLFNESSGTSVIDSNTISPMNGTATGTTIVNSEIGLANARKFNGTSSDKISLGTFACDSSKFSFICVVNISDYSLTRTLWSNRSSTTIGNQIYITASGYLRFCIGSTEYTLISEAIPLNTPVFICISINNTKATAYMSNCNPVISSIGTLNTTSNTAYLGYDINPNCFKGIFEYSMFGNFELTQAEVTQYYNALMATGRRNIIDDVLPTNSVALAFARTNSNEIIEYNDADYWTGRREKAYGGNRRKFLGWQAFSGVQSLNWESVNPFKGTRKIQKKFAWAQDATGKNESDIVTLFASSTWYGVQQPSTSNSVLVAITQSNGVAIFNGIYQTSGYIGCYAEVLEDYEGVDGK